MLDHSWSTPRPLVINPRERPRSLAKLSGNSPDYMGISPDVPGWYPRRSSHEDRRGAVGVTPSEVNTLVPYIPPIDTSSPPPSRECLDAMAKRFLADAHADFEDSQRNATTNDVTDVIPPGPSLSSDDSTFDYDTDSTLDGAITVSRSSIPRPSQQPPQVESETTSHDADFDSGTDTDTDSDTESDMSDDVYDWSSTPAPPSGPGSRWLIPRKRPSVVIVNNKEVSINVDDSSDVSHGTKPRSGGHDPSPPPSSEDENPGKRRRGGKSGYPNRVAKKPKRHANDTPARQRRKSIAAHPVSKDWQASSSEHTPSRPRPSSPASDTATSSCPTVSSITATALQMKEVRITSPDILSPRLLPQSNTDSVSLKCPKVFPCLLNGCSQVCASAGDLQRHQQSLRHRAPSHTCLACNKSYTRSDALKRHLNSKASCKKVHTTKVTNDAEEGEEGPEANDEAVQVVATSSS